MNEPARRRGQILRPIATLERQPHPVAETFFCRFLPEVFEFTDPPYRDLRPLVRLRSRAEQNEVLCLCLLDISVHRDGTCLIYQPKDICKGLPTHVLDAGGTESGGDQIF